MSEHDEWQPSLLSCVGALTDTSPDGWVYLARYQTEESEHPQGALSDVPPDQAYTRAEAIIRGREVAEENGHLTGTDILEEWAYTAEEARGMLYSTRVMQNPEPEKDCGCGGAK